MGTVVGAVNECREMFEGRITPFSSLENPVAYTLVRVAGDGRLVPATDEDILEVNETDMHVVSDTFQAVDGEELPSQLQKVEHGSDMTCIPRDANIQCSSENGLFDEYHQVHQADEVEACSDAAKETDFSLIRGEVCLDDLPIKALQETFRATFGRETTVKDKTWLKRRIAMGLTNSYYVPSNNLTVKDKTLVGGYQVDKCTNDAEDFERAAKRVRKPTRRYIEEEEETDKSMIPTKSEKSDVIRSISVSSGKRVTVTRMVSLAGSEIEVPYVSHGRRSRPRENLMALMECRSICLEAKASEGESPSQLNGEAVNHGSVVNSASGQAQKEVSLTSEHVLLSEVDIDMEPEQIDSSGNSSDDYSSSNIEDVPIVQGCGLRRKHHRAWTLSEVTNLVQGVSRYGVGKWSEIRKLSFSSSSYRTSVDLKDKWRNLLKASFAQSPSNSTTGSLKKHGSMHIPIEILLQVRELAEKQSLVPPGVSKVVGDSNTTEREETRCMELSFVK